MRAALYFTVITVLVFTSLTFFAGCSDSTPEAPVPPDSSVASPDLPTSTESPSQLPLEPIERWNPDGVLGDDEYLQEMQFGDFEIRWMTSEKTAYFGLRVKTNGWVAIGFSPSSRMKDADMVIGTVRGDNAGVSDQFSTGTFGPHLPDVELGGTIDIREFAGREQGDYTTIEFSRALDTGDKYDNVITRGTMKIILAYGSTDDTTQQHSVRRSEEITI